MPLQTTLLTFFKVTILPLVYLLFFGVCCTTPPLPPDVLFIKSELLQQVQSATQADGSHHAQAFQNIKNRVLAGNLAVYGADTNRYNRSYFAQEAALLSLLSTTKTERQRFAQMAFEGVKAIYEAPGQERLPHTGYGLSRAMMQLGLALPYAWCRQHWDSAQVDYLQTKISEALNAWPSYEHSNFGKTRGSNWVAVCRGGEMVLLLASGQKAQREDRYRFLTEELILHIQNGYGSLGVSQEGIGYTEYGGQFLMKAIQASASIGDSTLFYKAQKHAWWKQAMYIGSFQPQARKFLMTGVSSSANASEGWASLLFKLVPQTELPYFTWWYDRHLGKASVQPPAERFDYQRAGTIWSVLYYPVSVQPKDPTGHYPIAVADDHGYFFFRNRWQDGKDIMMSLMADGHHHSNAWDQPEVFTLNLMAHGTRYIGGPSKDRNDSLYSTILVEGKYNIKKSVTLTGKTMAFSTQEQEAFLAVDGDKLYQALGLEIAQRLMAVKFLADNEAIICLADTLAATSEKAFDWQLNLGDQSTDHGLTVEKAGDHFRLGSEAGQVEGWFFGPKPFHFERTDDPFRIHFETASTLAITILYVNSKKVGQPDALKKLSANTFELHGQLIEIDAQQHKIKIE